MSGPEAFCHHERLDACGFQNRILFHVRGTRKCGILTEEVLKMGNAAKGI